MPYGSAQLVDQLNFGDGDKGSIVYSIANARWEDGNGNALTNGADWTGVATTTLVLLRNCHLVDLTVPVGATLQLGADAAYGAVSFKVLGTMTVDGTITAGTAGNTLPGDATTKPAGGAAKTTAGAGNPGLTGFRLWLHGYSGGGGYGGGNGTHNGGAGYYSTSAVNSPLLRGFSDDANTGAQTAGTTGAGAAPALPPSIQDIVSNWSSPWMQLPSPAGFGGGSGALKQAGGANTSGAGGTGGAGKQPLFFSANIIILSATAVIHNDGGNGSNGGNGVATNAAGDISGGGGGGGGGAGGAIACRYGTLIDAGATWRSAGGAGGSGGLGYEYNAVLRPASDGGTGGIGSDGIIVKESVN